MANEKTDHDLLLQLSTDMCWLKKVMSNHLKHHWMITAGIIIASFGAIIGYILS